MIDLHIHSNYSGDADFDPAVLVKMCHEAGVTTMAIADHNAIFAIDEAMPEAKKLGINYIPATEIDCTLEGANFHILGYGIDHNGPEFRRFGENEKAQWHVASKISFKKTREVLGFDVTEEQILEVTKTNRDPLIWSGEMFAEALLKDPRYTDHPILAPYRPGGARSANPYVNFHWDYYDAGKPCYGPMTHIPAEEAISTIHKYGGIAVMAHPVINLGGKEELLPAFLDLGLDGMEVFSSYHDEAATAHYYDLATKNGLLLTCGSDFHGKTKPSVKLAGYHSLPGVDFADIEAKFLKRLA